MHHIVCNEHPPSNKGPLNFFLHKKHLFFTKSAVFLTKKCLIFSQIFTWNARLKLFPVIKYYFIHLSSAHFLPKI